VAVLEEEEEGEARWAVGVLGLDGRSLLDSLFMVCCRAGLWGRYSSALLAVTINIFFNTSLCILRKFEKIGMGILVLQRAVEVVAGGASRQ
jgi:hypothetical protein